ncbi:MAG: N-acetyl-gamma-glutamyl-phosphate reductase [Pseudomonadota bacterium]
MSETIQVAVLGATGYVGGELLRLIAAHPNFELAAAVSESRAGTPIREGFGHLASAFGGADFSSPDNWLDAIADNSRLALFSAAPHGASAGMLEDVLSRAAAKNIDAHVVDASADFRFAERDAYENIYGAHGAPELLPQFSSGVPEHHGAPATPHVGNPGCFATAMLLAIVPVLRSGLGNGAFQASGITGSTGSGRQPQAGTHHPVRHSNLYAYKPLAHRHAPEVVALAELASGHTPTLHFVPHSGPFARGIHMTVFTTLADGVSEDQVRAAFVACYGDAAFVQLVAGTPRLKDVVASNYAALGVATSGRQLVVTCVIDNLVKGAAGSAMQWMNRLFSLPDSRGLEAAAPAWT